MSISILLYFLASAFLFYCYHQEDKKIDRILFFIGGSIASVSFIMNTIFYFIL